MYYKRPRRALPKSEPPLQKIAAAKAGAGVVSIVSHDVPVVETIESLPEYYPIIPPPTEYAYLASGIIIECQASPGDNTTTTYVSTVLTAATVFKPYPDTSNITIDVLAADGVLYNAKLLASDLHYNLAALSLVSHSPLPTVSFKQIHDVISIDPTKPQLMVLRPHSDLFNVVSGTQLFTVSRLCHHPYPLAPGSGTFCSKSPKTLKGSETSNCNQLYYMEDSKYPGHDGGPVLSPFGDVIGMVFDTFSFLPSNLVLRWWDNYKSSREFRRPFTGVEVANLIDADLDFLAQFIPKFPAISTAVVVTKVVEDSPACRSGIQRNDVIVKLDGKPVRSKLEFYGSIWESAGKAAAFTLCRTPSGEELNLTLLIEEAGPDKFHQWPRPNWKKIW